MQIEKSRSVLAKFTDCLNHQIIFNSGSTEGISAVFLHCYFKFKETRKKLLLISDTEHAAPLNEGAFLENHGFKVVLIPTKTNGEIDTDFLTKYIKEKGQEVALVSVMAANNETGVIQPYERVGELCQQANILFLCDTTQILGKNPFSFKNSQADFITVSGHKLGALPGVGALIVKEPEEFHPTIHGGNQENGLRGGTQNYIGIETIRVAIEEILNNEDCLQELKNIRDRFEKTLREKFPNIQFFGEEVNRIANTSFLSLPGTTAADIQDELQMRKIFVTTSSACSDQKGQQSRVLNNMNIEAKLGSGAIRVSFCTQTTEADCDLILNALTEIFNKLNKTH